MKLFYSDHHELRAGWKVLRAFVVVIILVVLFAILAGVLQFSLLGDYAVHLAMIFGTLICLRWEHQPLSFTGLRLPEKAFWTNALLGFCGGSLLIGMVAAGMVLITGELRPDQLGQGATAAGLAGSFVYWLVVALGEESLFRGYIFSTLRRSINGWAALIISACLFGAIHVINPDYYWFAYIYAILIGAALGGILIKRGNLGGAIGFHYAWNLLQDKGILNMPERGGEAVYAVVLLVMVILVFWVLPGRSVQDKPSA